MPSKKLTKEQETAIRRAKAFGVPVQKLCRKYGVSHDTIERTDPKQRAQHNDWRRRRKTGEAQPVKAECKCTVCRRTYMGRPGSKVCKNPECREFRAKMLEMIRRIVKSKK